MLVSGMSGMSVAILQSALQRRKTPDTWTKDLSAFRTAPAPFYGSANGTDLRI